MSSRAAFTSSSGGATIGRPPRDPRTELTNSGNSSSFLSKTSRILRPASLAPETFATEAYGFRMPPNARAFSESLTSRNVGALEPRRGAGPW